MKAGSLFYFLAFVCILFTGCKRETIEPESIVGKWYVERYTTYRSTSYYNGDDFDVTPKENYESIGVFNFNADGTGDYFFDNQRVRFTFSIVVNSKSTGNNSGSFNGISFSTTNVDDNVIFIEFDKSDITSVSSPIIYTYYTLNVTRYEVFTKTKNTLRFTSDLNYNTSQSFSLGDVAKIDFILTKQ